MRKYILTLAILFAATIVFAQPGKKPISNEKPPTQKEMDEMMKEMQQAMNEMSPEDKKMMDSMGIKMPSMKNIPKVTDKQLADAWEDENRIVPKRDETRIATVSKTPLTGSSVNSFVSNMYNKTTALLMPASKTLGEKIYAQLKTDGYNAADIGISTAGLWITGHIQPAIYIMGKACTEDITNTDNLNNYASILSMCGAEQMAIPVLNYLNTKFPGNSTILNNLGQAWFGLGELTKAEKYFDSTIRIYAYHPQACLSKSLIEESKGNKTEAINLVKKSIKHSYSKEKEDRLRKLGYKLTMADVRLPFKPSADPLGLGRFRQPDYPKSVSELKALIPQWEAFDNDCDEEITKLKNELAEAGIKYEQNVKATMAQSIQAINSGGTIPASAQKPLYITKASLVLQDVASQNVEKMKNLEEKLIALGTELDQLRKTRKKAAPEAPCQDHVNAENDFLNKYNELKQTYNKEALIVFKLFYNDMAYWSQYTSTDKVQFDFIKLSFMIGWLQKLKEYRPLLTAGGYEFAAECVEKEDSKPGKLAQFDDVACQYHSELNLIIFKMNSDCSRMTTKIDAKFLKFNLKQDMDKETFSDQFMNCTIQVKGEVGIGDNVKMGPLEAGAKAEAGVEIEIDRTGVTDVSIIAGVKGGIGIKNEEGKVKIGGAGVETKFSLISGKSTVTPTGIFKGLK